MARNGGANFRHRGDESSRACGSWAISPMTIAGMAWASLSNMPAATASPNGCSAAVSVELFAFRQAGASAPAPDETFEMTFAKDNAAEEGFNRWTINGNAYPMSSEITPAAFHLKQGKRYRLRMRNASDDIHPIHLHRHSFELTNLAGKQTAGIMKDVVMLGGYQEVEVDFVADNPGLTLFHCHQQLHMDFGFMTLFDYV